MHVGIGSEIAETIAKREVRSNELWRALLLTLFPFPSFVFIWQRSSVCVCVCVCVFAFSVCSCWTFDHSCRTEDKHFFISLKSTCLRAAHCSSMRFPFAAIIRIRPMDGPFTGSCDTSMSIFMASLINYWKNTQEPTYMFLWMFITLEYIPDGAGSMKRSGRSISLNEQLPHVSWFWLRAVEVQCVPAEPLDLCRFFLRDGSVYTIWL